MKITVHRQTAEELVEYLQLGMSQGFVVSVHKLWTPPIPRKELCDEFGMEYITHHRGFLMQYEVEEAKLR